MSNIEKKEQQAIRLIQSFSKHINGEPIEVAYSGGKDSDVILALTQMADVPYRAIYKNTTIDPPGTIRHALEKGAEMIRPKLSFLQIVAKKGLPTRFTRFCCADLKEYKVLDYAIMGIRREESVKRAKRYVEPEYCRVYGKKEKVKVLMPILEWTAKDVETFIIKHNIKCAPIYYDESGKFHVERRLGCMGCPLQSDRGVSEFRKYPKLLRSIVREYIKYWNKQHENNDKSHWMAKTPYEFVFQHFFCNSKADRLQAQHQLFGKRDFKKELEDYFNVELP